MVREPSQLKEIAPPLRVEFNLVKVQEMNVADSEGVCLPSGIFVSSQVLTVPLSFIQFL